MQLAPPSAGLFFARQRLIPCESSKGILDLPTLLEIAPVCSIVAQDVCLGCVCNLLQRIRQRIDQRRFLTDREKHFVNASAKTPARRECDASFRQQRLKPLYALPL
jgi:predicted Fe-S protein YdhL (DUF1289 family)